MDIRATTAWTVRLRPRIHAPAREPTAGPPPACVHACKRLVGFVSMTLSTGLATLDLAAVQRAVAVQCSAMQCSAMRCVCSGAPGDRGERGASGDVGVPGPQGPAGAAGALLWKPFLQQSF